MRSKSDVASISKKHEYRRRVLFILPSVNPVTGGPARSIPLQAMSLSKLGYDVEIYSTWWPHDIAAARSISFEGVKLRLFSTDSLPFLSHVPYSKLMLHTVRLNATAFDIVHACSLWNPLISLATRILRTASVPYVITCHGMLDPLVFNRNRLAKKVWAELFERKNVQNARFLQFTTEAERDKAARCGWKLPKSVIVPVSVDISAETELPPRDTLNERFPSLKGREVVLFVGRINWVKNLDLLVDAFDRLIKSGRNAVLLCVGPDSDGHQAELERKAEALGLNDRVIFTGLLQGFDLLSAYARADALALISKKENFGQAAAEALVAGTPIVLSEGVDMGKHWKAPPVWRVLPDAESVEAGLRAALDFAKETGLPSIAARSIALAEWGEPPAMKLARAYEAMLDEQ